MAQPAWALGVGDEVWGSRLAQSHKHAWTAADTTYTLQELTRPTEAPEPKALACYGRLGRPGPALEDQLWRRFVAGRPVSVVTIAFLAWCSAHLAAQGFTAVLWSWDNASWHRSHIVRKGRTAHHRRVKRAGGCRLLVGPLPSKRPWLHPIEPC